MGIFDKFKEGLKKTRDFVSNGFQRIAANFGHFDEDMLEELEMLMIQADCGVECAESVMDDIRQSIRKTGDNSSEAVLSVLKKSMTEILGEAKTLKIESGKLNVLLMVGVNGTGKTTTSGKLAWKFKNAGYEVVLAAADTFRAAAVEQLLTWGERANTPVIANEQGSDPASVVYDAINAAQSRNADVLIVDTAGRLHNKKNLMDELAKIRRVISREAEGANLHSLLVIDATSGQNALLQAQAFDEATELDGLIITKIDGNAKGGVVLAVCKQSSLPVYYSGLGEGIDDLQEFQPDYYIDSLLPEKFDYSQK